MLEDDVEVEVLVVLLLLLFVGEVRDVEDVLLDVVEVNDADVDRGRCAGASRGH